MVEQVLRLTVSFTVTDAQMSAFKSIASTMTEGTRPEPGTLGYEWFAHADGKRFRLVETYADTAAVEAHFMALWCSKWCRNSRRFAQSMASNSMGSGTQGLCDGGGFWCAVLSVLDGNRPLTPIPGGSMPGIGETSHSIYCLSRSIFS